LINLKFREEEVGAFQAQLNETLQNIKNHQSSWPFLVPVNKKEVPDYYDVIKDPVDLTVIEKRLNSGNYYITKEIFLSDIKRMCDNCRIYNSAETEYYACANDIENEFLRKGRQPKITEELPI
jgi:histone acetyltransferase